MNKDCTTCRQELTSVSDEPCNCCVALSHWQPRDDASTTITPEPIEATQPQGVDAILQERGNRYGVFIDHARIAQSFKNYVRNTHGKKFDEMAFDQKEALDMIFHKIARILNGDPDYADSWIDIAGYAKLVADRLEGVKR